jgi:hypothetical protein
MNKKLSSNLLIGYSTKSPKGSKKREMLLMFEGFNEYKDNLEKIPQNIFGYMTTFVLKTYNLESSLGEIKSAWKAESGAPLTLEFVTDNPRLFSRDQKKSIDEIDEGRWSYRIPLCVYRYKSKNAFESTKRFILECALIKKYFYELYSVS